MAEVRLERIEKRFGATEVLSGIDLTIGDGELFTLVGPSGCGKSTLLHLIAGLEEPSGGEIYFNGKPVSHLAPKERDVAMVFQSYALYPHMSVCENLAFPLRMRKQPPEEIDREVRRVAEMLGLAEVMARKPSELSGGQRQRVALGRAIVRRPKAFLLDEPLSNLDAQLRIETRAELKRLHQRLGATMIYVTHDQAEAMTLSDRMAVLQHGKIQQCGAPLEIYHRPANLFVARFIGSPPINLLTLGEMGANLLSGGMLKQVQAAARSDQVILGVRPEDLQVVRAMRAAGFEARVSLVEPMGSETWLDLVWGEERLRARVAADVTVQAGEQVTVRFDEQKAHFFDGETGARLF